jgi:hypothetical protein
MRDIRVDLRDRANSVAQQIGVESLRFESLVSRLKAEQDSPNSQLELQRPKRLKTWSRSNSA